MNLNTTKWLLAAAAGLFAYIMLVERRGESTSSLQAHGQKVFPNFEIAKISGIEISRTNQTIRAEQRNDRWRLTVPPYPAQATGIENFLKAISELPRHAVIPAKDLASQNGWQMSFGFAPPRASVTVQAGTNRVQFHVGSKSLMGDQLYIQVLPEGAVYVTDSSLLDHLPESATEWRHPMLIHPDRIAFDRIAMTNGNRFLELQRDYTNQAWKLVRPPPPARADFSTVDNLIKELWNTRVVQFVSDDPKADLEPFGLLAPEVELTLAQGTNPVFQVQFGKTSTNDPTQVYARRLSNTNIVLLSRDLVESLRRPHTDFRDRTLLTFNTAAVDRIEVQAKDRFALHRQTNGAWVIAEPFQAPADALLVRDFFDNLARLEVLKFENDAVTDFSLFGLAPPARQYTLKTTITNAAGLTNQIVAQVDFSTNRADQTVWAKRFLGEPENSVYAVSYGESIRLQQSAFELRDRRIWNFASSNVLSLTVTQHRTSRTLRRAARLWTTNIVENEALEEALLRLGQLRAVVWTPRNKENFRSLGFGESSHRISLEVAATGKTQTYTVEFGKPAPRAHRYAAVSLEEGEPIIFQVPEKSYELVAQYLSLPPPE